MLCSVKSEPKVTYTLTMTWTLMLQESSSSRKSLEWEQARHLRLEEADRAVEQSREHLHGTAVEIARHCSSLQQWLDNQQTNQAASEATQSSTHTSAMSSGISSKSKMKLQMYM